MQENQTIRLAGGVNTLEGRFQEFTDSGLMNAILGLEAASHEALKLARAAKEELLHRKRDAVAEAYADKGDPFDVVRLDGGGFAVEINTARRVEWDQAKLASLEAEIRDRWKADPGEYIDRKLSVKEAKYKAWPSELRANFEPARTVKPSAPTVSITKED